MAKRLAERKSSELRRFLILGDESKLFPKSVSYPFNPEKFGNLMSDLFDKESVSTIKQVYNANQHIGYETFIYVLAVLAQKPASQCTAFEAATEICKHSKELLSFVSFYRKLSKTKGFGKPMRRFLMDWYNLWDPLQLAADATNVKVWHSWSHKDVLCMAHVFGKSKATSAVLKYIVKGLEATEKEYENDPECESILSYLRALAQFKQLSARSEDPTTLALLIELHNFSFDNMPKKTIKASEVVFCAVRQLPLRELLGVLPFFNRCGQLKPNSGQAKVALERLAEAAGDSTLGPLETFVAVREWQVAKQAVLVKSKQTASGLEEALQNVHLASFKTLHSSSKRYLIALDINSYMNQRKCRSSDVLTPSHVADLLTLSLLKADPSTVTAVAFGSGELVPLELKPEMVLSEVVSCISEVSAGPVVLSAPVNWALTKKQPFDIFVVVTTYASKADSEGLESVFKEYKETMNLPQSRYVISSLSDRENSFPIHDSAFVNIIGFNPHLPRIVQDVALNVI